MKLNSMLREIRLLDFPQLEDANRRIQVLSDDRDNKTKEVGDLTANLSYQTKELDK